MAMEERRTARGSHNPGGLAFYEGPMPMASKADVDDAIRVLEIDASEHSGLTHHKQYSEALRAAADELREYRRFVATHRSGLMERGYGSVDVKTHVKRDRFGRFENVRRYARRPPLTERQLSYLAAARRKERRVR